MVEVQTLGSALIQAGPSSFTPSNARAFATLLYLALEHGRPVPRGKLQQLIYGDVSETKANHSLRQMLYKLRTSDVPVSTGGDRVMFEAPVTVDYVTLAETTDLTDAQLDLMARGFLPGYTPDCSPDYGTWFESQRSHVLVALSKALLRCLNGARSVGNWERVQRAARAVLALDPLNEAATVGLAEAFAASGSKAKAMETLESYLREVGDDAADLKRNASGLLRRISERMPVTSYKASPELRFMGRDQEMRLIGERFYEARMGEPRAVVVSGEPGIGKTRLMNEFCKVAALDGARVVRLASEPHDVRRPIGGLVDLVPMLLDLPGALGCSPRALELLKRLTTHDSSSTELSADAREGESLFAAIAAAIRELIQAVTDECTLLLVADDTQWLDPHTLRFLGDIASARSTRRLLLLLTTRDSRVVGLVTAQSDRLTLLRLRPLQPEVVRTLLEDSLSGTSLVPKDDLGWMERLSGGNPLFVQTLAAHRRQGGEPLTVPASLRDLLDRRLARLDSTAFRVLQCCMVLGANSTLGRVLMILGLSRADLLHALGTLEDAALVIWSDPTLTLGHGLVGEVVAERTTPAVAAMLHYSAAAMLNEEAGERSTPGLLWDSVEHWLAAGDRGRAYDDLLRCAHHTLEMGRPEEAATLLTRAAEVAPSPEKRVTVLEQLVLAYDIAGHAIGAGNAFAALGHDRSIHDDVELAGLRASRRYGWGVPRLKERLLRCLHDDINVEHRLAAGTLLLKHADEIADCSIAHLAFQATSDLETSTAFQEVDRLKFLLVYHSSFGQQDKASVIAHQLVDLARAQAPRVRTRLLEDASLALVRAGETQCTISVLEEMYAVAKDIPSPPDAMLAAGRMADMLTDSGHHGEATRWLSLAEDEDSARVDPYLAARLHCTRARISLHQGDHQAAHSALKLFGKALEQCPSRLGRKWYRAIAIRLKQLSDPSFVLSEEERSEFTSDCHEARAGSAVDAAAEVICHDLVRVGRSTDVARFLHEYVSQSRRSAEPLSFHLEAMVREYEPGLQNYRHRAEADRP